MGKSIPELVEPDQIRSWLTAAFSEVGIATLEMLKDDQKIQKAALAAYERIPLFPVRVVIKATVGQDGFTAFVFRVRDKMLESNTTDLSWLTVDHLKSLWDSSKTNNGKHPSRDKRPRNDTLASSSMSERSSVATPQQQANSSRCPSCRYENRAQARFCRACGIVLSGGSVVSQSAVSPRSEGSGLRSHPGALAKLHAPDAVIAPTLPNGASLRVTTAGPDSAHQRGVDATPSPVPQTTPPPVPIPNSGSAPALGALSLRSGDSIESPRAPKSTPSQVHPSGKIASASTENGAARDDSRKASPAPSSARSQVESVTDVAPTALEAAPAPVAAGQLLPPARRPIGTLITTILAGVILVAGAGYFAMGGFWKTATRQNATSPAQTGSPPTVASLPATSGTPETSALPEAPAGNNPLAEVAPQVTPDSPATPSATSPPSVSQQPMATPTKSGKAVYASSCRSCHATGASGSPRLEDVEAWRPRLARSRASLYASVLEGKGAMPSRGGDRLLRDEEIRRAVDFMVAEARTAAKAAVLVAPAARTASPQPALAAPATPAPAAPADAQADWLPAMRAELERCRQGNFFERVLCTEKVKWKYCAPNRWNMVPECAVAKQDKVPGES